MAHINSKWPPKIDNEIKTCYIKDFKLDFGYYFTQTDSQIDTKYYSGANSIFEKCGVGSFLQSGIQIHRPSG